MPHQLDKDSIPTDKNPLTISLTESAVFLRSDGSVHNHSHTEDRPSVLRGLLILKLTKPTKISGIDVQLVGKSEIAWPEGLGARRVEVSEEHQFFHASTIYFDAGKAHSRRTASIGPGIAYAPEYDSNYSDWEELHHRLFHRHEQHEQNHVPNEEPPAQRPPPHRRNASVDVLHYQPRHVSYHEERVPAPPYSPSPRSPSLASPNHSLPSFPSSSHFNREASPAHNWRESRAVLNEGHGSLTDFNLLVSPHLLAPPVITPSRSPSTQSYQSSSVDLLASRQPSITEHNTERAEISHDIPRGSRTPRQSSPHARDRDRERPKGLFTLSAVSHALMDVVRSSSPMITRSRSGDAREDLGNVARGRTTAKVPIGNPASLPGPPLQQARASRSRPKPENLLEKVEEILKTEHKESGQGWKEFKKGTYTYPISFQIPGDSPPTLICDLGGVTWQLCAHVHRPGAFRAKYTAAREVIVVSSPTEDDTEGNENIIVERIWEQQLQYLIAISGRSFYIGGTLPITFTLLPIAKAKVYRVAVYLEERIDYLTNMRKIARSDLTRRFELICIRNVGKHATPILPLNSDDPEAFRKSPLYECLSSQLCSEDEISEMASSFLGPGPWAFHLDVKLPRSCSTLRPTNMNKRANMIVTHTLKVVLRMERGDDLSLDKNGKKKLFDVVIQTPVHILSCRCNPEWASLPLYAESTHQVEHVFRSCPCRVPAIPGRHVESSGSSRTSRLHLPPQRESSRDSTDSRVSTVDGQPVNPALMTSLRRRHTNDLELANTFERLVSGRESEMGEMPPAYEVA